MIRKLFFLLFVLAPVFVNAALEQSTTDTKIRVPILTSASKAKLYNYTKSVSKILVGILAASSGSATCVIFPLALKKISLNEVIEEMNLLNAPELNEENRKQMMVSILNSAHKTMIVMQWNSAICALAGFTLLVNGCKEFKQQWTHKPVPTA